MIFNLVSNLTNQVGLQQDYVLLRQELEQRGHTVRGIQFNQPEHPQRADVNIFLEVVNHSLFGFANEQWAVPNPEWWFRDWTHFGWDRILAKTHDCERIFKSFVGSRCQYVGWKARDLWDPTVERHPLFLHVCGKSHFKNTQAVIPACTAEGVPLTLIGMHSGARWVDDDTLKRLMNEHLYHVMPSAYEGYGHVLHEALGVGAIVITTDAPPMNELCPEAILIPYRRRRAHHYGMLYDVDAEDVGWGIHEALTLDPADVARRQRLVRQRFEADNAAFSQRLDALFGVSV